MALGELTATSQTTFEGSFTPPEREAGGQNITVTGEYTPGFPVWTSSSAAIAYIPTPEGTQQFSGYIDSTSLEFDGTDGQWVIVATLDVEISPLRQNVTGTIQFCEVNCPLAQEMLTEVALKCLNKLRLLGSEWGKRENKSIFGALVVVFSGNICIHNIWSINCNLMRWATLITYRSRRLSPDVRARKFIRGSLGFFDQ